MEIIQCQIEVFGGLLRTKISFEGQILNFEKNIITNQSEVVEGQLKSKISFQGQIFNFKRKSLFIKMTHVTIAL